MSLEALSQNDCDSEMSQSKGLQPEENSAQSKLLRDNIFEALEELKLKRRLEVTSAERVNQLLKEKYELCREKDEIKCNYDQKITLLTQKLLETKKELAETMGRLDQLENKNSSEQQFENQGIKNLKEEMISLQLAKHSLEKRLKEQDCRSELQLASRDSMMKQVKNLEGRMQAIEKQRDEIRNEIFKIESAAQKASLFQNRVMRVNKHQQCSLEACKNDLINALDKIAKQSVTIEKINHEAHHSGQICCNVSQQKKEPKQDLLKEKLEEQVAEMMKENDKLLGRLSNQTNLVNRLSSRLTVLSTSEMGLHFVIDDLKTENLKLKKTVQMNEVVDKGSQTLGQDQTFAAKIEDEQHHSQTDTVENVTEILASNATIQSTSIQEEISESANTEVVATYAERIDDATQVENSSLDTCQ
eukprot:Seg893.5 transcript_id=Seg893.5/GoldUCD/mRNA.D3Y31 product="Coiled-coil domain-containing protein 73" protein_id=Seg893.5/GoldUCD/D3Y31